MDPAAQAVLAVAGVSVTVILGALLAIARRDRQRAGGRTSARTIDGGMATPAVKPSPAPGPAPHAPPAPQAPPVPAPRARRLRLGRRAGA